jgi:probable HAF family extracellular repeat protein
MPARIATFVALTLCCLLVGAAPFVAVASPTDGPGYTPVDLGTLSGGSSSTAYGINHAGQVVGQSAAAADAVHAFLWQANTGMTDLGTLAPSVTPATSSGVAYAIDDRSRVVGASYIRILTSPLLGSAFVWQTGVGLQPLADFSEAFDINGRGQIVGDRRVSGGFSGPQILHAQIGGVSATNPRQDLGTLPGRDASLARGLNATGRVVGWSWRTSSEPPLDPLPDRAFLWQATAGMQDLGTLAGIDSSEAYAINDAGGVVGTSGPRAFLWQASTGMLDLGTLPGAGGAAAYAINNRMQVVGQSGGHAFVWQASTGLRDLGTLPGGNQSVAWGINDAGQIVGSSTTSSGQTHAVRWQPDSGPIADETGTLLPQ